jgi:hypothetical protein
MEIGSNWTTEERADVNALRHRNRELLLCTEFMQGIERPLDSMSVKDVLYLVGLQIEKMKQGIAELEAMRRSEGWTYCGGSAL